MSPQSVREFLQMRRKMHRKKEKAERKGERIEYLINFAHDYLFACTGVDYSSIYEKVQRCEKELDITPCHRYGLSGRIHVLYDTVKKLKNKLDQLSSELGCPLVDNFSADVIRCEICMRQCVEYNEHFVKRVKKLTAIMNAAKVIIKVVEDTDTYKKRALAIGPLISRLHMLEIHAGHPMETCSVIERVKVFYTHEVRNKVQKSQQKQLSGEIDAFCDEIDDGLREAEALMSEVLASQTEIEALR